MKLAGRKIFVWEPAQTTRAVTLLLCLIALVAADQWSKTLIVERFVLGESISVIGDWLRLSLVHNYGVAFGFLNKAREVQHYFLLVTNITITLFLIGLVLWWQLNRLERMSVGLIVCGAVGNIVDRFHYGYVVDFIDVGIGTYRWPVFNLADSCVSLGVVGWLIATLFYFQLKRPA